MNFIAHMLNAWRTKKCERVQAIERALTEDDWLIYCAQDQFMRFDWWWSVAIFHESVVKRFNKSNPGQRTPLKNETGKILKNLIERDGFQVVVVPAGKRTVGNITMEGGNILKRLDAFSTRSATGRRLI